MDPMIREQIAEIETLRQQLADVSEERDRLREWKESATSVMNATHAAWERCGKPGKLGESISEAMADEVIRLRAELLKQPPTLEWLREQFGKPSYVDDAYAIWDGRVTWDRDDNLAYKSTVEEPLETRAAVLAAVAATKETNDE